MSEKQPSENAQIIYDSGLVRVGLWRDREALTRITEGFTSKDGRNLRALVYRARDTADLTLKLLGSSKTVSPEGLKQIGITAEGIVANTWGYPHLKPARHNA